ncbi:TlpA disulfide reductase family protein [Pseudotenacibaculum sp. MALMAid0570]|uniref:TlpA disulfide reductase family protein n=1 Tax=Pseudotenacibaculum sp. MALMAid0570 TaxID=3143938 RepID=UPI0032DFA3B8
MRNFFLYLCFTLVIFSCKKENINSTEVASKEVESNVTFNSNIPTLNYDDLKPLLNKKDDKIYVVNFWATWCAPCVKELPYFENANKKYKSNNVEVLLVSLDFPKKKESKLIPFVEKKKIESKVVLLDDPNEQYWIANISEKWSGALPATLIYSKKKRKFYEQSFTEEELQNEIESFIN